MYSFQVSKRRKVLGKRKCYMSHQVSQQNHLAYSAIIIMMVVCNSLFNSRNLTNLLSKCEDFPLIHSTKLCIYSKMFFIQSLNNQMNANCYDNFYLLSINIIIIITVIIITTIFIITTHHNNHYHPHHIIIINMNSLTFSLQHFSYFSPNPDETGVLIGFCQSNL